MPFRRWFGLAAAVAYVGVLAHATAGAQCPVSPESGCAKVHALMLTARPPTVPPPMLAAPMRGDAHRRASASRPRARGQNGI